MGYRNRHAAPGNGAGAAIRGKSVRGPGAARPRLGFPVGATLTRARDHPPDPRRSCPALRRSGRLRTRAGARGVRDDDRIDARGWIDARGRIDARQAGSTRGRPIDARAPYRRGGDRIERRIRGPVDAPGGVGSRIRGRSPSTDRDPGSESGTDVAMDRHQPVAIAIRSRDPDRISHVIGRRATESRSDPSCGPTLPATGTNLHPRDRMPGRTLPGIPGGPPAGREVPGPVGAGSARH